MPGCARPPRCRPVLLLRASIAGRRVRLRIPMPTATCLEHAHPKHLAEAAARRLPRLAEVLRSRGIALRHSPHVRIGFQLLGGKVH